MNPTISKRRSRIAKALDLGDALLVVGAGDSTQPRSHMDYFYLAGQEGLGGALAYDSKDGKWTSFVPEVTDGDRIFDGKEQRPGELISTLPSWITARSERPVALLGYTIPGLNPDAVLSQVIRERFVHALRIKDADEIALLRKAIAATAAGYDRIRELIRPGMTERVLQIELEAEFFRHGATRTGFATIVGSGPNSGILHFMPTQRAFKDGDFILIDSGGEIDRYTADVTRTFVVGKPSALQNDLHDLVRKTEEAGIARCVPGAEWKEIHLTACRELVAGMIDLGFMRGDPEELVKREAHMLFFPCGAGHLVGLGVRDGSGLFPGRQKDPRPCLHFLRMDLPLAKDYVVTVEPGIYFIPAVLDDPKRRKLYRDCVDWDLVDRHKNIGGIRIEDDILVTDKGPEVLTRKIPKILS